MSNPLFSLGTTFLALAALALVFWPDRGLLARWRRLGRYRARVQVEDSLKHLVDRELEGKDASIQSIAGSLGCGTNRAAALLEELEGRRLLVTADGRIALTPEGRAYALRVLRAHRLWERHLADRTGFEAQDWHRLAERREHQLTPEDADALAASLGNPSYDPHGDPIPTADGELVRPRGEPLGTLEPGQRARIVHVEDEPAMIYGQLVAAGLHAGMRLEVLERDPERIRFWAGGEEHLLSPLLANSISVLPIQAEAAGPEPGIPLARLEQGQAATVVSLSPAIRGAERRRLMDLGLLPGTRILAELQSPSGDPTAYRLRGALIALRAEQARHIRVLPEAESITETPAAVSSESAA
jgi:DtxR family Mn-dependent transcriptional regulator